MAERCKVGVGVIIVHQEHMLLGVRMGSHCAGQLSFPGGHIDLEDPSVEAAGEREVSEEVMDPRTGQGLLIKVETMDDGRPQVFLRHDRMEGGTKAYVTLFLKAALVDPVGIDLKDVMPSMPDETHKCAEWAWYDYPTLCKKVTGKQYYSWADIEGTPEATKAWIPLELMADHIEDLEISYAETPNEGP